MVETLEVRQLLSTWTVTSHNDDNTANTLRWAINQVSTAGGDQTIKFALAQSDTIALLHGPLELNDTSGTLIIDGPGASLLTIDANQSSGVFVVDSENSAEIDNLTITGGRSDSMGAGINSQGTLTLSNCTVSGNAGLSGAGGSGIYSDDQLTINNSVITGNSSYGSGGGIYNGGELTVNNSTISGNNAVNSGGGIYDNHVTFTVSNSTISGNSAYDGGGIASGYVQFSIVNSAIINNTATHDGGGVSVVSPYGATITNCTIAGNSAGFYGGGISDVDEMLTYGSLNLTDDTISQNAPGGGMAVYHYDEGNSTVTLNGTIADDLAGYGFIGTYNLIWNGSGGLTGPTNIQGNPDLGALADNGGPTETMALLAGSPAIGAGSSFESTDQRGAPRFDSFDIGAYQSNPMHIFDATHFGGNYDFGAIGVPTMVEAGSYNGVDVVDKYGVAHIDAVQGLAAEAAAGSGYLCLDVENPASNATLVELVSWARDIDQNLKIGFYDDLDSSLPFDNLYTVGQNGPNTYNYQQQLNQRMRGIESDGSYNESDDVYRAVDFICPQDYPTEADSWQYERLAELESRDAQIYAAARTVTDADGTIVNIPKKPVYFFVSAQYIPPDQQSAGPVDGGDLRAILAQRDIDADGVILWAGGQGQDNFDDWFTALSDFATQQPTSVTAPVLTANASTMELFWTDPDPSVEGFQIYRSVHDQNTWVQVGYSPADVMNWTDQQMHEDITEPGTPIDATFDYKVRAITGIPTIYADSNIADATGSGIAPGRAAYANNLAVGWSAESGGTASYARVFSDAEAASGPDTNGGWLEYDNVDLALGSHLLNLNAIVFNTSTQVTLKLWYGNAPGTPGSVWAGSTELASTTKATQFGTPSVYDFGSNSMIVNIPHGIHTNLYFQFFSSSSTPNNFVWLGSWRFVAT